MVSHQELLRRSSSHGEALRALGDEGLEVVKVSQLVTIAVQDTQRRTVARTMRRTDELQGLMDHYYDVVTPAVAARGEGRFVFDGRRVKGEHTPEDLNMVSGDKIDFFLDLMAG
ncbi:hypothetical protein PR202_ga29440 [Eleusine coracana subsp. coracana]|uniref:Ubiquitin-like domain-containing protein n=1 Tax=Eleusine coracana subsp. coracana TaxID=191504 RepID=A0AAV5DMB5_ELECO|nr:hypothetical protein PR202_ga29440 [Eleusine coracana subsp. coracana]